MPLIAVPHGEPDRAVAFMLKLLVVMWGAAAVLHCTGLFGYGFFQFEIPLQEKAGG
jgi:hypothetical protein